MLQRQATQAGMMPQHHQQPQGQMGVAHPGVGMVGPHGIASQAQTSANRVQMEQQQGSQGMMVGAGPMQQQQPQQAVVQGQMPPQMHLQQPRMNPPLQQQQWPGQGMPTQQRPAMMAQPGMVAMQPSPQQQQQQQQPQQVQQQQAPQMLNRKRLDEYGAGWSAEWHSKWGSSWQSASGSPA